MLKLIGAFLLTGGGLILGLAPAGTISRRLEALAGWRTALELWEGELAFRLPDLPQLFGALSRRTAGPAGEALAAVGAGLRSLGERTFEEIWVGALLENAGPLDGEDLEPLLALGQVLSRCGWEDQRQGVERARQRLEERMTALRRELTGKGKAWAALGFSLGAFLTILLL